MAAIIKLSGDRLTFDVSGGPGTPRDFVAVYRPGTPDSQYLNWKYSANDGTVRPVSGKTSGTVNLTMPLQMSGLYEVRFISVNTASGAMKREVTYGPFSFDPIVASTALPPPPPPPPPHLPSPDGTTITGGTGELFNADGTWTFGQAGSGQPPNWQVVLNGVWIAPSMARLLEIAKGGKSYHQGIDGNWYVWQSGPFQRADDPNDKPPLAIPTAIRLTPASLSLADNSPINTQLCSSAITMSDGSVFSGKLATDSTLAGISGPNLTLSRSLTAADDGVKNISVTAAQNGTTVSASFFLTVTSSTTDLSPDGTTITDGTGQLKNKDGTWAFGQADTAHPGYWQIMLNGAWKSPGVAKILEIAQGGKLFHQGTDGGWYVWQSGQYQKASDPNITPGDDINFVSSFSPGNPRGGNGNFMGMRLNLGTTSPYTGPTPGLKNIIIVKQLGRWVLPGNSGSHVLKIIDATTGLDVPGSSVTVNTAGKPANAFTYGTLPAPVSLGVNQPYYIVSLENNSDQLLDNNTHLNYTPLGFVLGGTSFDGSTWNPPGPGNSSFGPLDFIYTLGEPIGVGSPLPVMVRTSGTDHAAVLILGAGSARPLSGTVVIDGYLDHLHDQAINSIVVQYWIDGKPASPYISGPISLTSNQPPNFPWTLDTTTLSNGTHHIIAWFIDSTTSPPAYLYRCSTNSVMVQNPAGVNVGDYSGPQKVPTGMTTGFSGSNSPLPDFVNYPGSVPPINPRPRPAFSVPPTNDPKYRGYNNLYIEDMSGSKLQEFVGTVGWSTTRQGGVFIDYHTVDTGGGTIEDFYPTAFRTPTRPGGRMQALDTPLSTFIAAEGSDPLYGADTGYLGIELRGSLIHKAWDGTVTHLAGITWDSTKLGFSNTYAKFAIDEDTALAQCVTKGVIVSPEFDLDDFGGLNDLCYDPRDYKIVYLANGIYSFIIKVDRNFDPPHCSVYAGVPDDPGYVNGPALTAKFHGVYSIVMCDGSVAGFPIGTMLALDHHNGAVRRISPDGSTVDTLCGNQTNKPTSGQLSDSNQSDTWSPPGSVPFTPGNDTTGPYVNFPFTLRFTSDKGKLVFSESYTATFRILDLRAKTVTRIPGTKGVIGAGYNGWWWFDIDTVGAFGPKDDIAMAGGVAGISPYSRISLDGSYNQGWVGDGAGALPEGPGNQPGVVFAPLPIYAWVACFAKTRAHFLGGGFRYYGVYAARPQAPSDPVINADGRVGFNSDVFGQAQKQNAGIWYNGTSMCFPLGSRPGFASLYGELGNSLLGSSVAPTFDDLAEKYPTDGSFTDEICAPGTLGRYIQDGGAGTVPRPELTGNDLRALCYYIRRTALSGTYPRVVEPGPVNPDQSIPIISAVSASKASNDSLGNPRIQVSWTTNKRTIGLALAGSPAQAGTLAPYSVWSEIEKAFGTSHSAIVTVPKVSQIHFSVIAKDVAGNSAYAMDQVIDMGGGGGGGGSLSPDGSKISGQSAGGGDGTLTTAYGAITFGDKKAPPDGTHAGTFCVPLLNGIEMNPAGPCGAFGLPAIMQLWIANGGRIYGVGNDQLWQQWAGYRWVLNGGNGLLDGPSLDLPPGPLPTYSPPYTPSAEGSSISGGAGSLQTIDGKWEFGDAGSGGWRVRLNGIDLMETFGSIPHFDQLTVNGHGRMFLHHSDGAGWTLWAMHQENPSTGPTASPVPINLSISPSRPEIHIGSSPDTFVADISVMMSDGSPFTGSLDHSTSDGSTYFKIVGSKIFVSTTPPRSFYVITLSAQQNGATLRTIGIIGVS